ncbi:esterase-like activity of phytase-domain-containing protein [Desarmillaria tabescens]|uniref:Esterase-like activity of phytase-domain-containing protein n=1 Tax=Armillaria tabescens TaxID=1929756 RepID=A0AA39K1A3_ARMTA|nr:esterase-like activity of phytase-domain-containing protein [Desarmillaria tabescens]KAK0451314.1 esterase-like activity of phytase-domain-containing protein [Desarmillaria tabescens]
MGLLQALVWTLSFSLLRASPVKKASSDTSVGIVAFGRIPSDAVESTGDTLGGIGSAMAIKYGTWTDVGNGSFSGILVVHPDRGFNVDGTVNYQARQHDVDFVLTPYYGTDDLSFDDAQGTLVLIYKNTTLQFDRGGNKTTGLDSLGVRPAMPGFPSDPFADPQMPVPITIPNLSVDAEGIIANSDGSYWVSDEYGPYIYRFSGEGQLIQTIQPPSAILPRDSNGNLNFTSESDPTTGRAANQGFEGLTFDVENDVVYAMLQSATIQDGGDDKTTSRYTRLLAYDVSNPTVRPELIGEWVVPLPQSKKNKTRACSEIAFVSPGVFFALSRDGDGEGGDDLESSYKQADLFDISNATDIHGTKFDDPANPIAVDGELDGDIVPATYVSFVDYIDDDQLARFGLQNGDVDDDTHIDAKWESFSLAPVNDSDYPNDYFLFTASDNDFLTTNGISLGQPYDAGQDVDNQFLVFRVTLPSVIEGSVQRLLGV